MCGRTCLTLEPNDIRCACSYQKSNTNCDDKDVKLNKTKPEWRSEYNFGRKYEPSYNIAPTDITPVLVSMDHFTDYKTAKEQGTHDRLLVPMMWGMIPFWHKGDYKKHGLTTNNCRLEHMLDSKLYRGPFQKGQRCVILCEGFYEWQTTKSAKPSERSAFLLHMPQADGIKIYDKSTWKNKENGSNKKVNLLKLAGLFDVWEDEIGDKIYSYSAITFESCGWMSWLHHRMPAILETDQQVSDWLDFKRVSDAEALAVLKPSGKLNWHQVSKTVNNSRNKSDICNKPIEEALNNKGPKIPKSNLMKSWLLVRKRKEEELDKESSTEEEEKQEVSQDTKRSKFSKSTT